MEVNNNYSKIKLMLSKKNGQAFYQIYLDEKFAGEVELIRGEDSPLGKKINMIATMETGFEDALVNGMELSQKVINLMNGHFSKKGESVLLFFEYKKKQAEEDGEVIDDEGETSQMSGAKQSTSSFANESTQDSGLPSSIEELTNELEKAVQTYTYPEKEPTKTTIINDPILTLDLVNIMTENRKPETEILRVGNTFLNPENQVDATTKTKKETDDEAPSESENQN